MIFKSKHNSKIKLYHSYFIETKFGRKKVYGIFVFAYLNLLMKQRFLIILTRKHQNESIKVDKFLTCANLLLQSKPVTLIPLGLDQEKQLSKAGSGIFNL